MKNNKSVKLNNNPLPYLVGSLLIIFSIIFVYYLYNGNSLEETNTNSYYSQSSTTSVGN